MKVSIIIPVYNVEKYLNRCVDSVIEQTYEDLEIILVDDGSKDNSGQMCDEIALKDSRIIVHHQENGGLSAARNAGLEISSGEYIFFLDSDDYLTPDCIEKAVSLCKENDAQIAIMQMLYTAEDTNEVIIPDQRTEIRVMNSEEAIEASLYQRLYSCCAPSKLYKKEVLEGVEIPGVKGSPFPLKKVSEDLATCHLFMHNANCIVYSNEIGYYYRQHGSSIMHIFNSKRIDAIRWTRNIERFCKENYPDILSAARCRTFNVAVHLLLDLPDSGEVHDKYYPLIWKEIRRTRIPTILCKKVRMREKAAAVLSFGGEKLLKRIWNSKVAVKQKEQ